MIVFLCEDKLMIEIGEVKEGTHFLEFGGGQPSGNTIEFHGVHSELSWFYDHSKIFNLRDVELAFFKLKMEIKLSHLLEDMTGSFFMSFGVRGGNKEVVHVNDE